ncbi:MAG: putative Radical SAM superfamily protein [Promethearchaeota archaeon]|nr:MAG: putative Radical SAM superfamily protein [Candidatus Lokiarchaeota archaeon]
MKLLYIITQEIGESEVEFLAPIPVCRISNYLNSRKDELTDSIEELLIDLRCELPEFIPEQVGDYRAALSNLLCSCYKFYPFELVAISCYGSGCYLNTLEVAYQIRNHINKDCVIIAGGPHVSLCPEDFYPQNFPESYSYLKETMLFDYLIQGEGERPFFTLIKTLMSHPSNKMHHDVPSCVNVEREQIIDLNTLPILNLELIHKYKKYYIRAEALYLDFTRGCPYKCSFCINSYLLANNRAIRTKSLDKCIKELEIIIEEGYERIHLCDSIFLSKKKLRSEFFKRLKKSTISSLTRISVSDRIDFCSDQDLKNYAKLNIIPRFGLETLSTTLIQRINKTPLSPKKYLQRFKQIVKLSNKVGLKAEFNVIINLPGTNIYSINEMKDIIYSNSMPLIENYAINFIFRIYYSVPKTYLYMVAEEEFGTKFLEKQWWKVPTKDQKILSNLVIPSRDLSLKKSLSSYYSLIKEIIQKQAKFDMSIYKKQTLLFLWGKITQIIKYCENYNI